MPQLTKGIKAFAIYFIVWGIITFLSATGYIIYHVFITAIISPPSTMDQIPFSSYNPPSALDWVTEGIGIISGIILFFAGLFILRAQPSSLPILKSALTLFIVNNILSIIEQVRKVLAIRGETYAVFSVYGAAFKIAFYIFSVFFWTFIIWFFFRQSVRSQLQ